MRLLLIATIAGLTISSLALAQTPPATPAAPAAKTAPADGGLTRDGKPKAKLVRAECRAAADAKSLKGPERREAIKTCFAQKRPDLAKAADCRKEAKAKGLKDAELKAAVKACRKG